MAATQHAAMDAAALRAAQQTLLRKAEDGRMHPAVARCSDRGGRRPSARQRGRSGGAMTASGSWMRMTAHHGSGGPHGSPHGYVRRCGAFGAERAVLQDLDHAERSCCGALQRTRSNHPHGRCHRRLCRASARGGANSALTRVRSTAPISARTWRRSRTGAGDAAPAHDASHAIRSHETPSTLTRSDARDRETGDTGSARSRRVRDR